MPGNDNLFGDADAAPEPPAATGPFNLAGLFDSAEPAVANIAGKVRRATETDVHVVNQTPASAEADAPAQGVPTAVQRPKPIRPVRIDGSFDVARRADDTSPAAEPPAEPIAEPAIEPPAVAPRASLTQPAAQPNAAPTMTEPLQWLTPSALGGAGSNVRGSGRSAQRAAADESGAIAPSSLRGLVKTAAPTPTAVPAEAMPVLERPESPTPEPARDAAREQTKDEVHWAPRNVTAGSSVASEEPRGAGRALEPAERTSPPRVEVSKPPRFTMTGKDWAVALISLGVTAAAIAGIYALL